MFVRKTSVITTFEHEIAQVGNNAEMPAFILRSCAWYIIKQGMAYLDAGSGMIIVDEAIDRFEPSREQDVDKFHDARRVSIVK